MPQPHIHDINVGDVSSTGAYIKSFADVTNNAISNYSEVKGFSLMRVLGKSGNNWIYDYNAQVYVDATGVRIYSAMTLTQCTVAVVLWY